MSDNESVAVAIDLEQMGDTVFTISQKRLSAAINFPMEAKKFAEGGDKE